MRLINVVFLILMITTLTAINCLASEPVKSFEFKGLKISPMPNDPFIKLGLKVGDVVISYDDKPIVDPAHAMEFYNKLKSEEPLTIIVERDNHYAFISRAAKGEVK